MGLAGRLRPRAATGTSSFLPDAISSRGLPWRTSRRSMTRSPGSTC